LLSCIGTQALQIPVDSTGLGYTNFRVSDIPWSIHVVRVTRSNSLYEVHSLHAGKKAIGLDTLSEQLGLLDPALGSPVAAVNGDFYQRDRTYAGSARGLQVVDGHRGVVRWSSVPRAHMARPVAARLVPAALGTDTGGSIRQPAALCGVVGLKPTYGRVSRYGLVAFASSLDQIGPFARSCADAALLLGVIAGHDPRDATSYPEPAPNLVAALSGDVSGLRIGLPRGFFDAGGADAETLALTSEALQTLQGLGAKTVEVELPNSAHGIATYYLIATAEASSNLSRYDGVKYGFRAPATQLDEMYERTRSEGFGAEVKRRILLGTYVLSAGYYDAYYRKAQQVRTLIRRDFERAFESCDVIATPATPTPAWPLGERVDDPLQMYLADVYTVTANLAGLPGLSLPVGFTKARLPVGLQLLGRPLDEATVLRAGDAYQRHTHFHEQLPEGVGA
jgi:aspartyl-tRNA(Asn)/glutamyl-tRNA(Gln) amidotransferase subunit A